MSPSVLPMTSHSSEDYLGLIGLFVDLPKPPTKLDETRRIEAGILECQIRVAVKKKEQDYRIRQLLVKNLKTCRKYVNKPSTSCVRSAWP